MIRDGRHAEARERRDVVAAHARRHLPTRPTRLPLDRLVCAVSSVSGPCERFLWGKSRRCAQLWDDLRPWSDLERAKGKRRARTGRDALDCALQPLLARLRCSSACVHELARARPGPEGGRLRARNLQATVTSARRSQGRLPAVQCCLGAKRSEKQRARARLIAAHVDVVWLAIAAVVGVEVREVCGPPASRSARVVA